MLGAFAYNLNRALRNPQLLSASLSSPLFLATSAGYSEMAGETLENGPGKPITRVLFCGLNFPSSHNFTIEYLKKYPFIQVDVVPLEKVPEVVHLYHLCVVKMCHFDSALLAKASKAKLIMQFGVGLEGGEVSYLSTSFVPKFPEKVPILPLCKFKI